MDNNDHAFFAPRLVLGAAIILVGVLFLLGNMGIINPHDYLHFWPAILVVIGIAYLLQCQRGPGKVWGIILIFIGSAMLLDRLYFIDFNLWDYWPLILVFVGISMIVRSSIFRKRSTIPIIDTSDSYDFIKAIAVMGGYKRKNNSQNFKGGELTAVMGGLEIDLREASFEKEAVLDIFAFMGGMEVRVPEDWIVIIEGFPFMGGFDDKTRPEKNSTKRLIVKGTAVMGGIEIKN
jgi:predicted membrane protein